MNGWCCRVGSMGQCGIIEKLRSYLEDDSRIKVALLFGSFAQGREGPGSDIDLGIAFETKLSLDQRIELALRLSQLCGREVDIVDLRVTEGVLLQQILNHRKTLVRRDGELVGMLLARRVTEEVDFMPLLDMMLKHRRERFTDGKEGH